MANITVTAAQVGLVDPLKAVVRPYIAAEAITKGQAVYLTTAGKAGVADADAAGKLQFRGIALNAAGAGQAVDVCHEGEMTGFTVSGLNGDVILFLSNDVGQLADAAGATSIACARVTVLTDKSLTKVIRVFTRWSADWA